MQLHDIVSVTGEVLGTTTVLIIENDTDDDRLLTHALQAPHLQHFILLHATNTREATRLLATRKDVEIILCDVTLPDSRTTHIFQALKRVAAHLPVVFLASPSKESLAVSALQLGAEDYLIKGQFSSDSLVRSIRYALERKKFQNDLLAAKVKSRQLRSRTRMLKQKSVQLQALNDVKDDFIALASHQLRTPATGVRQYIAMLRENYFGALTDTQRRMLDIAHESNERQLRIVDDLLKIAKVDSGYFTLHKEPANMINLIQSVIDSYSDKVALKNQKLTFIAGAKQLAARIDIAQFRMVLENLLDNAHLYTPADRNISVRLDSTQTHTVIDIQDEGVGISKHDQSKLFQKFRRINNPLSDTFSGSGLGLYWAKRIVALHGGDIKVYSTLGKGTIFSITI